MPTSRPLLGALVGLACLSAVAGCAPAPEDDVDESGGAFTTTTGGVLLSVLKNGVFAHIGCPAGAHTWVEVTSNAKLVQHAKVHWSDGTEEEADLEVSTDERTVVTSVPSSKKGACGFSIRVTAESKDGMGVTWQTIRLVPSCGTKQGAPLEQIESGSSSRSTGPACG